MVGTLYRVTPVLLCEVARKSDFSYVLYGHSARQLDKKPEPRLLARAILNLPNSERLVIMYDSAQHLCYSLSVNFEDAEFYIM